MLLITTTRIPNGYRLLASSSHRVSYYCWTLYRNQQLLKVISRSYHGDPCVTFDLLEPLAPGEYQLRVEGFGWPTVESPLLAASTAAGITNRTETPLAYYTNSQSILSINSKGHCLPWCVSAIIMV